MHPLNTTPVPHCARQEDTVSISCYAASSTHHAETVGADAAGVAAGRRRGCGARRGGGGQVRDVFGLWVLRADGGDARVGGFAGFGEGVVAGVEVFAFLERGKRMEG